MVPCYNATSTQTCWARLDRFLFCGSAHGHYSVAPVSFSGEDIDLLCECLAIDGNRTVMGIIEAACAAGSVKLRRPAVFALALASSPDLASAEANGMALAALPEVARTPPEICTFAAFVDTVRGWGRALRSAIASWYVSVPAQELAAAFFEFAGHDGWTHRDLLRLSHPKPASAAHNALFQWAVEGELGHLATADVRHGDLRQIYAWEQVRLAAADSDVARWIEDHALTADMIPEEWKVSARVWEALLDCMGYREILRHLEQMRSSGLLAPGNPATALAVARLMDRNRIRNAGVQPAELAAAMAAYGRAPLTGSLAAALPCAPVLNALEEALYASFDNVEPCGKRIFLCFSPSSDAERVHAAAFAMTLIRCEPRATVGIADPRVRTLNLTRKHSFSNVFEMLHCEAGERCALVANALEHLQSRGILVDGIVVAGAGTAATARDLDRLAEYRGVMDAATRLVVVDTAGEPKAAAACGPLEFHVAGYDATVPSLIMEFLRA